jgi:predicted porin
LARRLTPGSDSRRVTAASQRGSGLQKRETGSALGLLRANYWNNPGEAIANNGTLALAWAKSSGEDLLDLTAPASPKALFSAIHAVTVNIWATANLTAGGRFTVTVYVNSAEAAAGKTIYQIGTAEAPNESISLEWFCAAGAAIQISIDNHDGAASRTFMHNTFLQLS